jgi:hypothetical protein
MPTCRASCQAPRHLLRSGALDAADAALTDERDGRQGVMTFALLRASE